MRSFVIHLIYNYMNYSFVVEIWYGMGDTKIGWTGNRNLSLIQSPQKGWCGGKRNACKN
jgi:hypothetical protein